MAHWRQESRRCRRCARGFSPQLSYEHNVLVQHPLQLGVFALQRSETGADRSMNFSHLPLPHHHFYFVVCEYDGGWVALQDCCVVPHTIPKRFHLTTFMKKVKDGWMGKE